MFSNMSHRVFTMDDCQDILIKDCVFRDIATKTWDDITTIIIANSEGITVSRNILVELTANGFGMMNVKDIIMTDNRFDTFLENDNFIGINNADGLMFTDNEFTNCPDDRGVDLYDVFNFTCIDNRFEDVENGITMQYSTQSGTLDFGNRYIIVHNNIFRNMDENPLMIQAGDNIDVRNNTFDTLDSTGPFFQYCGDAYCENNTVKDTMYGTVYFFTNGHDVNTTFSGNVYDMVLSGDSRVYIRGSNLNESKIWWFDSMPKLIFQIYVNVSILDPTGVPVSGSELVAKDYFSTELFDCKVGQNYDWMIVNQRQRVRDSNITLTPTTITATFGNHSGTVKGSFSNFQNIQVTLDNSLPIVGNLMVQPFNPKTDQDIVLSYDYLDLDGDPESGTWIKWFNGSTHMSMFDNLTTIPSSQTVKGQIWYSQVIPYDGIHFGKVYNSSLIIIRNTPPVVSNLSFIDQTFRSDQPVELDYDFFDQDGDTELGSIYKWSIQNGTVWEEKEITSNPWISPEKIDKEEKYRVEVLPFDGYDYGTGFTSEPFIVVNTPPQATQASVTPLGPDSETDISVTYQYYDKDSDHDNGTLLEWYVDSGEGFILSGLATDTVQGKYTQDGETWKCKITPMDGTDFGGPIWSNQVVIGNSAPSISGISFSPLKPTSLDNITCIYQFVDPDSDPDNGTIVEWLKWDENTNDFVQTGIISPKLEYYHTAKYDVWACDATPSDGKIYGAKVRSDPITISNSKPVVLDPRIIPVGPNTTSSLDVSYVGFDNDGDDVDQKVLKWYRDGQEVEQLQGLHPISSTHTAKGQTWYYTIQVQDKQLDASDVYRSAEIVIGNFRPTLLSLSIVDEQGSTDIATESGIMANITYFDADGDPAGNHLIKWYRNGLHQQVYDDLDELPSHVTSKGEYWYVEVTPFDGSEYGLATQSSAIRILNSGPNITSFEPSLEHITISEGEKTTFKVEVEDKDRDFLFIKWYLNEEPVSDYYSFNFEPGYQDNGFYFLNVSINDIGVSSVTVYHNWTIQVLDNNRAPLIDVLEPLDKTPKVKEGRVQAFKISVYDPDTDDDITIKWYLDNELAQTDGESYSHYLDYSSSGKYNITVEVSDGSTTTSKSWEMKVTDYDPDENKLMGRTFDEWGIAIEIFILSITVVMGLIGFIRYKKKRSHLKGYMREIKIINEFKQDLDEREKALIDLREDVVKKYKKGDMDDNHFLIVEKKLEDSIRKTREAQIEEDLDVELSLELRGELNDILADGVVSEKEFVTLRLTILNEASLTPEEKRDMLTLIRTWRTDDKGMDKVGPVDIGDKKKKKK